MHFNFSKKSICYSMNKNCYFDIEYSVHSERLPSESRCVISCEGDSQRPRNVQESSRLRSQLPGECFFFQNEVMLYLDFQMCFDIFRGMHFVLANLESRASVFSFKSSANYFSYL